MKCDFCKDNIFLFFKKIEVFKYPNVKFRVDYGCYLYLKSRNIIKKVFSTQTLKKYFSKSMGMKYIKSLDEETLPEPPEEVQEEMEEVPA